LYSEDTNGTEDATGASLGHTRLLVLKAGLIALKISYWRNHYGLRFSFCLCLSLRISCCADTHSTTCHTTSVSFLVARCF